MPNDLPPWDNIYDHFRRWKQNGTFELIHHALHVHEANIHDSIGARSMLSQLRWEVYPRLEVIFADAAFQGPLEAWCADHLGL